MKNITVIINLRSYKDSFCKAMEMLIDNYFHYPDWHTNSMGMRVCHVLAGEGGMMVLQALVDADCIEIME